MTRQNLSTLTVRLFVVLSLLAAPATPSHAQTAKRDAISEILKSPSSVNDQNGQAGALPDRPANVSPSADARTGEADFEQAKALMAAVDDILKSTAETRSGAARLPSRDEFILPPIWTETREARDEKVRNLIDSVLAIVTDVPVVAVQAKIDGLRRGIRDIEDQTAKLKEKQVSAPKDAALPGLLNDTVQSIDAQILENHKAIDAKKTEIAAAKSEVGAALRTAGVTLEADQIDLLLDGVLSGDLVRLVAVFDAAKIIDAQLAKLVTATGDNMAASRRYFAMHAALFAMLVQAQDATISKIDDTYQPKLDAILEDIQAAKSRTAKLLKAENRDDQKRALDANRDSQKIAEDAAKAYRRYLQQQRDQLAKARAKASHDLSIADNTYETVEASVQLRNLMRESATSFEAIQKLEAPSFEQIFKNDALRREFENLTQKLDAPSS